MNVELAPFSMLMTTPLYEVGGVVVPGLMTAPVVPHSSDTVYTVTVAGERRLDLISSLFYGTTRLWWVIASVNGLTDPLAGVAHGSQIRIPRKERLADLGIMNT